MSCSSTSPTNGSAQLLLYPGSPGLCNSEDLGFLSLRLGLLSAGNHPHIWLFPLSESRTAPRQRRLPFPGLYREGFCCPRASSCLGFLTALLACCLHRALQRESPRISELQGLGSHLLGPFISQGKRDKGLCREMKGFLWASWWPEEE